MNLINSMLWSLSGYDKVLCRFTELRQHFKDDAEMIRLLDAALRHHFDQEIMWHRSASPDPDKEITDRLENTKEITRALWRLLDDGFDRAPNRHLDLAINVAVYAMHLGALGTYGPAPWRRLSNIVMEHKELADAE